jgi:hypothetical protein
MQNELIMNKKLAKKIENAQNRTQKRFNSALWETGVHLIKPIDIQCENVIWSLVPNGWIVDFFLSKGDKWPFISVYGRYAEKNEETDNSKRVCADLLVSFGSGKKTLFKKAGNIEYSFDLDPLKIESNGVYKMAIGEPVIKLKIN